jgi:small subunit ribosomal protein S9
MSDEAVYCGTGRRKTSVARVRIKPGTGTYTINSRPIDVYFGRKILHTYIEQPFKVTETMGRFDDCSGPMGSAVWPTPI